MFTYYTDWQQDDPKLGRQKWQTFLTRELPPVVDEVLGGANGINAIAGLSMSATSALDLAIQAPGLYRAAASYSGCAQTGTPARAGYIRSVVEVMGEIDATNMWGPFDGPGWKDHDPPTLNAERLRGLSLYISNGTGLPGPYENPALPRTPPQSPPLADQIVVGGTIEAATNVCTRALAGRLNDLGIPATFHFRNEGTHSWGVLAGRTEAFVAAIVHRARTRIHRRVIHPQIRPPVRAFGGRSSPGPCVTLVVMGESENIIRRRDAHARGVTDIEIRRLCRSGIWTRLSRGVYVPTRVYADADERGRHLYRALAAAQIARPGTVLGHVSAAIAHGLELWRTPLDDVHLTCGRSGGETDAVAAGYCMPNTSRPTKWSTSMVWR